MKKTLNTLSINDLQEWKNPSEVLQQSKPSLFLTVTYWIHENPRRIFGWYILPCYDMVISWQYWL